jgi:hypothetical protein
MTTVVGKALLLINASSLQDVSFQNALLPLSLIEHAVLWYYRQLGNGDKILVGDV